MSHVSFSDISYLNSTISLVRIFLVFVGPLGIILLPRISQALAQGKVDQVKRGIEMLLMWVLFGGLLMSFSLSLFGPEILKLWLGNVSVNGAWTARVLLIALPFYAIVGVLRSPIDAASERGYNSIIYSLAAVLLLISFFLMKSAGISVLKAGVISFLIGYITAAIFSLLIVYKLLNVQPFNMSLLIHMIAGCLLVVVGNYIVIRTHLQHSMQIVVFFLAFLILFLIFVLKSRREWVIEFRKQALGQNKVN
jgi:O-antigen/teichoic acid export membrane protein